MTTDGLPIGLQVGLGTRAVGVARNFAQGSLQQTGGSYDMAVLGNGTDTGNSIRMPAATSALRPAAPALPIS